MPAAGFSFSRSFLPVTLDSSFNKRPHNTWLQPQLRVRSPGWVLVPCSVLAVLYFDLYQVKELRFPASTCRRGQHKRSVSIGLPRNTKPAHHSAALSLPSWTLIPCCRLYTLYNLSLFPSLCVLHFLFFSAPSSLIGFLRLCLRGFMGGKSQVSLKVIVSVLGAAFFPRLIKEHSQTVDKCPSFCLKTVCTTLATN